MFINQILFISVLIATQISIHLVNAQEITISLNEIKESNEKLIVKTSSNWYILMNTKRKLIEIVCQKSIKGFFTAFVDGTEAVGKTCNGYLLGNPTDDYFCSSKSFEIDLTNSNLNSDHFNIVCNVGDKTGNLKLYKLCEYKVFKEIVIF